MSSPTALDAVDPPQPGDGVPALDSIPHPARSRIFHELRADVVGAYQAFLERGLPPDEARRRARDLVVPSAPALASLIQLHTPLYQRMAARLAPESMHRAERLTLIALSVLLLSIAWLGLGRVRLLDGASPFLPAVVGLGVVTLAAAAAKAFQLFVKRDHGSETLRRGLVWIPGLSLLTLGIGIVGGLVEFHRLTGRMEANPDPATVLQFIFGTSAILALSISLALAGALVWFLLHGWIHRAETGYARAAEDLALISAPDSTNRRQA